MWSGCYFLVSDFMIHVSKSSTRKGFSILLRVKVRFWHASARPSRGRPDPANALDEFESLGVNEFVVRGLRRAFPHINAPTLMQKEFIPAIASGKDVLLQDRTGTGKSLGLLLALLSKTRASRYEAPRHWKDRAARRIQVKEAITSILIVPHNDLALQFSQWIKMMRLTRDPDLLVQTLLQDSSEDYEDQLIRIGRNPPHILITTPKALGACWSKGKHQLTLDAVSTIVLEEADILLRVPSNNTPIEVQRRWRKHPPVVRKLLADVFTLRPKNGPVRKVDDLYQLERGKPVTHPTLVPNSVQLVLASATLRPAVRKFLFLETKWLNQQPGETLTIEGTRAMDQRRDPVRHYGLFVDVSGSIRNVRNGEETEQDDLPLPESISEVDSDGEPQADEVEGPDAGEEDVAMEDPGESISSTGETLLWNSNRLASQLLDAVVSVFVFNVPKYALLIIPSTVSAKRTVEDLRALGVKAINLDDYVGKPAKALHNIGVQGSNARSPNTLPRDPVEAEQQTAEHESESLVDDPIMLVAIQAAVRGIDLPSISHVFIAGVPESDVEYLHLAGRVGRMGAEAAPKGGTKEVITFLPEPNLNPRTGGRKALEREKLPKKRLEALWNMIGIKPNYYGKAL